METHGKISEAIRNMYSNRSGWDFCPPPEAPLFCPTAAQFKDPLAYINQIRHIAEKTGICKIRPPQGWQPPFSLDVDQLKFTPRVQKLNDLEGVARIKTHFATGVQNYWIMKGKPFKMPRLDGKQLDLFSLHRLVRLEGGAAACAKLSRWRKVASLLGCTGPRAPDLLREIYETIVSPYDDFVNGKSPPPVRPRKMLKTDAVEESPSMNAIKIDADNYEPVRRDYRKPKNICRTKEEIVVEKDATENSSTLTDHAEKSETVDKKDSPNEKEKCKRELRRLACYGAGPKMPGLVGEDEGSVKRKKAKIEYSKGEDDEDDPLGGGECLKCKTERASELIWCSCGDCYHVQCAEPPQMSASWRCAPCLSDEILKPPEPFGFAQAERPYTLQEFGEMADRFKLEYFNMPGDTVPPVVVEKEFWRIVCANNEDVTVEYGADLHSMDHGSGFPTASSVNLFKGDKEYADSGWNLNNLPVLKGSVLRFMNAEISGMTVPWMYVGMCFSAFCWHYEDHWSYSINFLHWGEPKTWYGVPGDSAELLETTMKAAVPELFQSQPDLLHQLVTVMNPNVLMEAGVPVFRTDQNAGEFIVTFPRSYHTGFNQGYNFAEAVNFAPPDWLPLGRESVSHYKSLKRFCVFSHEELVCRIASVKEELDFPTALAAYKELQIIVENETKSRGMLAERGVKKASLRKFEIFMDDERVCDYCKTTCFLSSLSCDECKKMVCLDHAFEMCKCAPEKFTLQYRFNLDELHVMLQKLKSRVKCYDQWMTDVRLLLSPACPPLNRLNKMVKCIEDAKKLRIPQCKILENLNSEYSKATTISESLVIELDDD